MLRAFPLVSAGRPGYLFANLIRTCTLAVFPAPSVAVAATVCQPWAVRAHEMLGALPVQTREPSRATLREEMPDASCALAWTVNEAETDAPACTFENWTVGGVDSAPPDGGGGGGAHEAVSYAA